MPGKKDRLAQRIMSQYEAKGYSHEEAERIAWATVNKQQSDQSQEDTSNAE